MPSAANLSACGVRTCPSLLKPMFAQPWSSVTCNNMCGCIAPGLGGTGGVGGGAGGSGGPGGGGCGEGLGPGEGGPSVHFFVSTFIVQFFSSLLKLAAAHFKHAAFPSVSHLG